MAHGGRGRGDSHTFVVLFGIIKRSFVWIIIFIVLVPTAYPAFKQLGLSFYSYIIEPLLK